jgi:hypothetical protein
MWVFNKLSQELIEKADRADVVICDRSLYDVAAYTAIGAGDYPLAEWMVDYAKSRGIYQAIHFHRAVENEWLHDDGLRETDPVFRYEIDSWLEKLYKDRGIAYIQYKGEWQWTGLGK